MHIYHQCKYCKNYGTPPEGTHPPEDQAACRAFEKIPDEITFLEFLHTKPYPGDRGIQFEPIDDLAKEIIESLEK